VRQEKARARTCPCWRAERAGAQADQFQEYPTLQCPPKLLRRADAIATAAFLKQAGVPVDFTGLPISAFAATATLMLERTISKSQL